MLQIWQLSAEVLRTGSQPRAGQVARARNVLIFEAAETSGLIGQHSVTALILTLPASPKVSVTG